MQAYYAISVTSHAEWIREDGSKVATPLRESDSSLLAHKLVLMSRTWYSCVCEEPQLWTKMILGDHLHYYLGGPATDDPHSRREWALRFVECSNSKSKFARLDIKLDWGAGDYDGPTYDQETPKELVVGENGEIKRDEDR